CLSSRRRHTRSKRDWSSDVCSSDLLPKNLSYIHEDDFFRLLESKAGHVQIDFPRDLKVKRSYEQIILSFESSYLQDPSFHKTIDVPGKTELPDASIISATYMDEI